MVVVSCLDALFIHASNSFSILFFKKKSMLHLCLPWQQVIIHSYEERLLGCVAEIQTFVSAGSLMMAER